MSRSAGAAVAERLAMNLSQLSATEIAFVAMCSVPFALAALLFVFA
jgi:hypothetical protein